MRNGISFTRIVSAVGSLILLFSSANSMASENIELTGQFSRSNLQAFRDDEKFTLALLRNHNCERCDKAELEMQQWYEQTDTKLVSTLIINIDGAEKHEAIRARQLSNGIHLTSMYAEDPTVVPNAYKAITGEGMQAIPAFLFFGPDGDFIADHVAGNFDWITLEEMLSASHSGLFTNGATNPTETIRNHETAEVKDYVRFAQEKLYRKDYQRAENLLQWLTVQYPLSQLIKVEFSRQLILTHRKTSNTNLKYSIEAEEASKAERMLLSVLEKQPSNTEARSVLVELYLTQGDLKKAKIAMDNGDESYFRSHWANYNNAMYDFVHNKHADAMEELNPVLQFDAWPGQLKNRKLLSQQAWQLAKRIGDSDNRFDPIPVIRAGLVERVLEDEVIATLEEKIHSEIPVMLIVNSEDTNCTYCKDAGQRIEVFVKENQHKYQFLYVSIEPWHNLPFHLWAKAVPNLSGVPTAAVFSRGRYIVTGQIPTEDVISTYDELYPRLIEVNNKLKPFDFERRIAIGNRDAAHAQWWDQKQEFSAFASVVTADNYAWGAYDSQNGTQAEADQEALKICQGFAKKKGIRKQCISSR